MPQHEVVGKDKKVKKVIIHFIKLDGKGYLYDNETKELYTEDIPGNYVGTLDLENLKINNR